MEKLQAMLAKDQHNEDIVNNMAMAISLHTNNTSEAERMLEVS